jgi:hypothetical protein
MLLRTIVVYNCRQFTLYSLIYALLRTYVMLLYIYLLNTDLCNWLSGLFYQYKLKDFIIITRKYMHAETLALLNSKHDVLSWLHDIIRIVLKLKNPPQIITFNYKMINYYT